MSIRTRLQHLERLAPLPACPECLDWVGKTVLVIRGEPAAGQDPEGADSPLPCARCGT